MKYRESLLAVLIPISCFVACTKGFSCTFDRDQCSFTQRDDDNFDWKRHRYSTSSQGTGPDKDHTSGRGYYMYIEASNRRAGDKAVMDKTITLSSANLCLTFYYHMWGRHIGTLNVYVGTDKVFSKLGRQGNRWTKASVQLSQPGSQTLSFEATAVRGFQGDIAIDDVSIGSCDAQVTPSPWPPTAPPTDVPTNSPGTRPPQPPPGSCGYSPKTRIIGGKTANHGDWPWQVQLKSSLGSSPFCGGSLIHPQWVLTASHCVSGSGAIDTLIRLGAHRKSNKVGTEQDFKITKVITHPSYHKPLKYANDIALLKLDRPAILNKFVNLVCLPDSVPIPDEGDQCWITGWGNTLGTSQSRDYLQQASVPIVGERRCRFAYFGQIHGSMICAGLDRGGVDSCQGDSGGPMVCRSGGRFYIHGVTSWGKGCGRPGKFGVYSKVKYELNWIHDQMKRN